MSSTAPDDWGIQARWLDAFDEPHDVPDATVTAFRDLIGTPPDDLEDRAPIVTRRGRPVPAGTVTCEDGAVREVVGDLDDDFPLGYHRLTPTDPQQGPERLLVVSPGRCWLPEEPQWGVAVQLYAARSAASWGIGDLADLRSVRRATQRRGGGFLLVNPLHAVGPTHPQEASPYLPATRRFRNPVYLSVEEVPGFTADLVVDQLARVEALRAAELVDRDAVWTLKDEVLRAIAATDPGTGFEEWRADQGESLTSFAIWSTIALEHGPDWSAWPPELRDPDGAAAAAYAAEHAAEVTYQAWLQWLLDGQLREATGELTVIQDLPIGVSGGGSDGWVWQSELAHGVSVGAPPDLLNTTGQDWGSPPLVPWRLLAADLAPFVESLRATIAGAGGLRIDHVMGLFRLWWVPEGEAATAGAYVRYPSEDLLDVVALESHRARAVVVGEDLGTVEPGVREALVERGILSYRLLWFEEDDPADWPELALGAVTTHDLPTVAGLWTGSDVDDQLEATDMDPADVRSGHRDLLARLDQDGSLQAGASVEAAVTAAYTLLGRSPCLLRAIALEDIAGQERRPNVPGTTERTNWRIPLPMPLDELLASDRFAEVTGLLGG